MIGAFEGNEEGVDTNETGAECQDVVGETAADSSDIVLNNVSLEYGLLYAQYSRQVIWKEIIVWDLASLGDDSEK